MKKIAVIALATAFFASSVSAEPTTKPTVVQRATTKSVAAPALSTIPQLKAQKTKLAVQKIKPATVAPAPTPPATSGSDPSAAYRQGNGVVLRSPGLVEPTTGSGGDLWFAALRRGGDSSFARVEYLTWINEYGNFPFIKTEFRNLPSGPHSYMVSLGMNNVVTGGAQGQLYVWIAGSLVPTAAQLVTNGVIRTLISYDATGGRALPIEVGFAATSRGWVVFDVHYVQVAQID